MDFNINFVTVPIDALVHLFCVIPDNSKKGCDTFYILLPKKMELSLWKNNTAQIIWFQNNFTLSEIQLIDSFRKTAKSWNKLIGLDRDLGTDHAKVILDRSNKKVLKKLTLSVVQLIVNCSTIPVS